jgi:hypothetical protein
MSDKYCTLVGSRKNVPSDIKDIAQKIGFALYKDGWIIRSGGALGMDKFFEKNIPNEGKYIYTVKNFDFSPKNYDFCFSEIESVEPDIKLDEYDKASQILILRDVNQVLGSPETSLLKSKFLICWTPHLDYTRRSFGGTRFAVKIALKYKIPVFNLKDETHRKRIEKWLYSRV